MKLPKSWSLILQVFVPVALVVAFVLLWNLGSPSKRLLEGKAAPDFILQRVSGEPAALSGFRGRPLLLSFWAAWCDSCARELPHLAAVGKEFSDADIGILAVNVDDVDVQEEVVGKFLSENPEVAPYVALGTPEVGASYLVNVLPTFFVIDRSGQIVEVSSGELSEAGFRAVVKGAISR